MQLCVNGVCGKGAVVAARAPKYVITGKTKADLDQLVIASCHRQVTFEKERTDFAWTYEPRQGLEDTRDCPLEIQGVEKGKNRSEAGFIAFENPKYELPAQVACDGSEWLYRGMSVCPAPAQALQRVVFYSPVIAKATGCEFPDGGKDGATTFEFAMPRKPCPVRFLEIAEAGRSHLLILLPYDSVIPKEF